MKSFLRKFGSLKVTCVLLVSFLLLIFWGVLGQSAAGNEGVAQATERFFNSYFLWALGVIPLPAMKSLALIAAAHLVCSLVFRMPRGFRNAGLWGMHLALVFLLVGGVVGSDLKREYNGYRSAMEPIKEISFFEMTDSLEANFIQLPEGYPYFVFYKGQVDMFGIPVEMYTATYDPMKFVPYAFMALFLFSAFFHYAVKVRKNHKVQNVPVAKWPSILPVLFLGLSVAFAVTPANAQTLDEPTDPVMVNGVLRPYDSFARGVLNEFNGHVTFKDESGTRQTASSMLSKIQNHQAAQYKLFKVLRSDVQVALGLPETERYVSFEDLNRSRSQLELYASRKDEHPATMEMQRLLANVQLYESIQRSDFKKAAASPEQVKSFKAEVSYNRANFALLAFIFAFIGCALAAVNSIFKKRMLDVAANLSCGCTVVILAIAFAMRLYIAGRPPLSSLYEIVLLVALLLESFEFGAFLFCKKRTFSLIIPVTMMAALLLFFAKFILEPGDLFQPVPVILNSSVFLTVHVFAIALGFAGVILSGVVAHVALFRITEARLKLLFGTLIFGTVFSVIGTLLGGVWADFAWGRFWGFDPKECGALFVILWTMLGLHLRDGRLLSDRGFALFNSFNVIVTFLCWFGINLLGVGLHSYGFQGGTVLWLGGFVLVDSLAIFALSRSRKP